jgi:hypothetical protein
VNNDVQIVEDGVVLAPGGSVHVPGARELEEALASSCVHDGANIVHAVLSAPKPKRPLGSPARKEGLATSSWANDRGVQRIRTWRVESPLRAALGQRHTEQRAVRCCGLRHNRRLVVSAQSCRYALLGCADAVSFDASFGERQRRAIGRGLWHARIFGTTRPATEDRTCRGWLSQVLTVANRMGCSVDVPVPKRPFGSQSDSDDTGDASNRRLGW